MIAMNLLRKAIAAELLSSSPRSPRTSLLSLHNVATMQQSRPFSTSAPRRTASRSKSSQQGEKSAPSKESEPQRQPSWSSSSCAEIVQKEVASSSLQIEEKEKEREMEVSETKKDWPRPSEIPWQGKVANSVNLIGRVEIPVQFQAASDGKFWAGTIISRHDDGSVTTSSVSPPFWIPIIFEGDLAHIAACHLKEKDCVHIAGQLIADPPPFNISHGQANVQVMVRDISFIEGSSQLKKSPAPVKKVEQVTDHPREQMSSKTRDGDPTSSSWSDLIKNPTQWSDYREKKLNGLVKPKHPDFKHKESGIALWLNSAPSWVISELEGSKSDVQHSEVKKVKACKDEDSWKDLVENPEKWWDNRSDKANVKSPDFKHKDTRKGLWLSSSPAWVQPRLPPLRSKESATFGNKTKLPS